MKLLLLLFSLLCIHTASPVKQPKNKTEKRPVAKASYKMAPSILIVATY